MRSWLGRLWSDHLAQERLNWLPSEDGAMVFWSMRSWMACLNAMHSMMSWSVLWVLHSIVRVFLVHWELWWWKNWAFFELVLQQSNLILVGLGAMMLGFWLFLWSDSICKFCTWYEPLHCVHLNLLSQWNVSFKLGPSFTNLMGEPLDWSFHSFRSKQILWVLWSLGFRL